MLGKRHGAQVKNRKVLQTCGSASLAREHKSVFENSRLYANNTSMAMLTPLAPAPLSFYHHHHVSTHLHPRRCHR